MASFRRDGHNYAYQPVKCSIDGVSILVRDGTELNLYDWTKSLLSINIQ